MFQMRFHGRGGQGVVTAAEMISVAAFIEGKHAQAFPSFGSERMGAPVVSFCRISERKIRLRDPVFEADALVIQDPTLLQSSDIFKGLKDEGYVLINSSREAVDLGIKHVVEKMPRGHVLTVPATDLALKHIGRPLPNTAMLGGLAAITGIVRMDSIARAIGETFAGAVGQANTAAATEAYAYVAGKQRAFNPVYREAIAC